MEARRARISMAAVPSIRISTVPSTGPGAITTTRTSAPTATSTRWDRTTVPRQDRKDELRMGPRTRNDCVMGSGSSMPWRPRAAAPGRRMREKCQASIGGRRRLVDYTLRSYVHEQRLLLHPASATTETLPLETDRLPKRTSAMSLNWSRAF